MHPFRTPLTTREADGIVNYNILSLNTITIFTISNIEKIMQQHNVDLSYDSQLRAPPSNWG